MSGSLVLAASSDAQVRFADPVFYATPASPSAVAVADVDGDGDRDILVLTRTALRLLVNDGSGSFTARDQVGLWSHEAHDVAVADLDRDGDPDLTVAMSGIGANGFPDGTGRVGVAFNRGDGLFAPAVLYSSPGSTLSVATADLNGDGFRDVASTGNSFRATVFLNDGAGTLTALATSGTATRPHRSKRETSTAMVTPTSHSPIPASPRSRSSRTRATGPTHPSRSTMPATTATTWSWPTPIATATWTWSAQTTTAATSRCWRTAARVRSRRKWCTPPARFRSI